MKRLLTLVIALVMMLPVLSSRSIAADAGEQRDVKELYLISDKVNDDHIAYANSEKENVLMALKDVVSLDGFVLEDMISFGKPFNLNESTYIPIIIGNKIVALMAVSDFEGELGWTLSKDFSDGLNQISKLTSLESPASFKSIYLSCDGTDTYKKANHALVLRGYNTRNNTYSVWNPWNDSYVSMSISSKSISVNGGKFIWSSTIYGW